MLLSCRVGVSHTVLGTQSLQPSGPRSVSPSLGCLVISQDIWQLSVAPSKCFHLWLEFGLPGLVRQMEKLSEQAAARASLKSSQCESLGACGQRGLRGRWDCTDHSRTGVTRRGRRPPASLRHCYAPPQHTSPTPITYGACAQLGVSATTGLGTVSSIA